MVATNKAVYRYTLTTTGYHCRCVVIASRRGHRVYIVHTSPGTANSS